MSTRNFLLRTSYAMSEQLTPCFRSDFLGQLYCSKITWIFSLDIAFHPNLKLLATVITVNKIRNWHSFSSELIMLHPTLPLLLRSRQLSPINIWTSYKAFHCYPPLQFTVKSHNSVSHLDVRQLTNSTTTSIGSIPSTSTLDMTQTL